LIAFYKYSTFNSNFIMKKTLTLVCLFLSAHALTFAQHRDAEGDSLLSATIAQRDSLAAVLAEHSAAPSSGMDYTSIAIGVVVGAIIGYLLGSQMGRKSS
jgi:hypothetical protein